LMRPVRCIRIFNIVGRMYHECESYANIGTSQT
jgi:hypothetical protein